MNTLTKAQILAKIAAIEFMERGTLSPYTFPNRSPQAGPYFKLQNWEQGKNHTRYVPAAQVPLVREALAGYAQYRQLTEQLAQWLIQETRQQFQALSAGLKKKTSPGSLGWPKSKKSNS